MNIWGMCACKEYTYPFLLLNIGKVVDEIDEYVRKNG